MKRQPLYGFLAEFETPEELVDAARRTSEAGYRRIDAFAPMPIHGLAEACGFRTTRLPVITLIGGILGGSAGFGLQYFINVINFPLNIGGKPFNSWPSFIPVTFELTILGASLATVFGMLILNGLPTPYHPVFNVPRFALATRDRFFLCIKARDQKFDPVATRQFLEDLKSRGVYDIES